MESALAQTHTDLELVISDNGSTDGTEEICRSFAAADERVRYLRQEQNRGAAWNHNAVVHASRGEYFRWYSYDDQMDPRLIEACLAPLQADPDLVLAYPLTYVMDDEGRVVEEYRSDLPWQGTRASERLHNLLCAENVDTLLCWCYPVYGLMRRRVLLDTRLLRPHNSSDAVLLVELALRGRWHQVPERLFYSRRHAESSVGVHTPEQVAQWFDPAASADRPMVRTMLFAGYVSAIWRAPLTPAERRRCFATLGPWLRHNRNGRVVASELRHRARARVVAPVAAGRRTLRRP
ncbi:hypothetical protein ASD06_12960 [Angustibacter sp. Root456]|nr:hypothetical protein ASD06_12960 [Angustibacter sp. Root456]